MGARRNGEQSHRSGSHWSGHEFHVVVDPILQLSQSQPTRRVLRTHEKPRRAIVAR
jgi:hypothetical protein